ncbi:hypothetical protein OUZ56_024088 [Daphnia magna]|uniref:Uncharacterized protein n=1 Tax=Daphnia magna TaxID=35525 RepID=A0ABR0B0F1_9CRUS|nr:hypothetical protein OUZ56_024088 [Daphnia magna]
MSLSVPRSVKLKRYIGGVEKIGNLGYWPSHIDKLDKLGLYKRVRKHSVPDEEKWELYQINIKQTYDDLNKSYAALKLYFKRIELADLGKVLVPQNSDIPSFDDEILGGGRSSRIRKQKEVFSPPQPARRSRIVVEPNPPVLTLATQSRVTYPKKLSSKEAAEGSRDII